MDIPRLMTVDHPAVRRILVLPGCQMHIPRFERTPSPVPPRSAGRVPAGRSAVLKSQVGGGVPGEENKLRALLCTSRVSATMVAGCPPVSANGRSTRGILDHIETKECEQVDDLYSMNMTHACSASARNYPM